MAKLKLTKNELKRQREALNRYRRYLPMLLLKKKQLQAEIQKLHREIARVSKAGDELRNRVDVWVDVFGEDAGIESILKVEQIKVERGNIAGVDIPLFSGVVFRQKTYDLETTPLWVDAAVGACREMIEVRARLAVCHRRLDILKEELHTVSQRVNLFEKVKIPECQENIRAIQIYLGDLQVAEVVRGKIAKQKLQKPKQPVPA